MLPQQRLYRNQDIESIDIEPMPLDQIRLCGELDDVPVQPAMTLNGQQHSAAVVSDDTDLRPPKTNPRILGSEARQGRAQRREASRALTERTAHRLLDAHHGVRP